MTKEASDLKAFGRWVQDIRKEKGMTGKELAEVTGIPYSRLRSIESGSVLAVGPKTRNALMEALGAVNINHISRSNVQVAGHDARMVVKKHNTKEFSPETLLKIVEFVLTEDFAQNVEIIKKTLKVDKDKAILIVLENMLNIQPVI